MKYIDISFIFLCLGAIVGAGFSSGKEIIVFFTQGGKLSFLIIIIISICLYHILKSLINFGQNISTHNISDINKFLFKKSYKFFNVFILFGLFIFITAMISGLNSLNSIILPKFNFPLLTILSILFSIFIVLNGYKAIKYINNILMPIVLTFVIVLSLFNIFNTSHSSVISFEHNFLKYLCLGICYVSYNIVFSSSLIIKNSRNFSKKQIKTNSLFLSLSLGLLLLVINFSMIKLSANCYYSDLPMLNIAFNINNAVGYMFAFVLWFSILTSLISSLYMLINAFKLNKLISSCLFLSLAFAFSSFGFNFVLSFCYPLQGAVGIVLIVKIMFVNFKIIKQKSVIQKSNP